MSYRKYRIWCKHINIFTDQPSLSASGGQLIWHHTNNVISVSNLHEGDYIVQQFTGIKDQNGKEIFEGDIVETIYGTSGEIVYSDEIAGYRIKINNTLLPLVTYRFVDNVPTGLLTVATLVVGNIFQT